VTGKTIELALLQADIYLASFGHESRSLTCSTQHSKGGKPRVGIKAKDCGNISEATPLYEHEVLVKVKGTPDEGEPM
jgi:hypothetical protein